MSLSLRILYLPLLLVMCSPLAHAAENTELHYDQVNLSIRAGGRVDTDIVVAIVYKEHQSTDQATAAREVNNGIQWAADKAKAAGVDAVPFQYRTSPVYQKKHIAGWRVHQSLRLESEDPTRIGALLGELQQKVSIQSLSHTLSPGARVQAEETYVVEALGVFEQRAKLIADSLKRSGYKIVRLNINTDSSRPINRSVMAMADSRKSAPVVEGGQQQVNVSVNGTIELLQ
jgi:predicted secreted protein